MSEKPAEMTHAPSPVEKERAMISDAQGRGPMATLATYIKLSGPGWLQSAITLGGGSLAGSLYLGVLGGFSLLWLQPIAMILGVIMLSAIAYVTLSTGERPFKAINEHINPVLGWGWAIATLMANIVWCLPQYALATAATKQNLLPALFAEGPMAGDLGTGVLCLIIAIISIVMVWSYNSDGAGVRIFNIILKVMVASIVISFFGVVVKMSTGGVIAWEPILKGFVPDLKLLTTPAATFTPYLDAVAGDFRSFWSDKIVGQQQNVMITAAATAVGINMTFLLPYSMLRRGWDKQFRGLAIFDLSTGLFVPFILATSCVVIASAAQFHAKPQPGLLGETGEDGKVITAPAKIVGAYKKMALARVKHEMGDAFTDLSKEDQDTRIEALPMADKQLAAMLVKRDAFNLAQALEPLTGKSVSHYVFGFGVVGMAVSSIIILMLINGFTLCEILGREWKGWTYRIGSLIPCLGVLGPLWLWKGGKAQFWLAVPTSLFGMMLIPVAYVTFMMMMNSKSLLGDKMPRGKARVVWNLLMGVAVLIMGSASVWTAWNKSVPIGGKMWPFGRILLLSFVGLAVLVHIIRTVKRKRA